MRMWLFERMRALDETVEILKRASVRLWEYLHWVMRSFGRGLESRLLNNANWKGELSF